METNKRTSKDDWDTKLADDGMILVNYEKYSRMNRTIKETQQPDRFKMPNCVRVFLSTTIIIACFFFLVILPIATSKKKVETKGTTVSSVENEYKVYPTTTQAAKFLEEPAAKEDAASGSGYTINESEVQSTGTTEIEKSTTETENMTSEEPHESIQDISTPTVELVTYVVNTNSGKYHSPGCKEIDKMSPENRLDYSGSKDEFNAMDYQPCQKCHPK